MQNNNLSFEHPHGTLFIPSSHNGKKHQKTVNLLRQGSSSILTGLDGQDYTEKQPKRQ